jgi:mRNA interferase MazF
VKQVRRGEIWLLDRPRPDKRRPVVVLTRDVLVGLLDTFTVCAVTSTRRGASTEVPLGVEHGLKGPSCANAVHLFTVRQAELRTFVGSLRTAELEALCDATAVALGCD